MAVIDEEAAMFFRWINQAKSLFRLIPGPTMRSLRASRARASASTGERGQASAEMAVIMPVFVLILTGIMWFARLAYFHLALLTTANDCAAVASHEPDRYYSTASVVQGAYGIDSNVTLHHEAGASLMACSAFTNVWPGLGVWYTVHMPTQPYASIWP
jgi:hypothetical protein